MLRFIILLTVLSLPYALCGDYLITAPDVFRTNVEEDVLVSIFGSDGNGPIAVPVTVTLTTSDGIEIASQTSAVTAGEPKVMTFIVNVADLPSDEEIPTLTLRAFSDDNRLSFDKSAIVLVTTKNQVVFIQTDKPIYTPDQEVKIRVISLNEEMKPTDRNVRLEITTPRGSIIERRDDLSTNTGYITEIFSFSSYPTFGIWTINVHYGRNYEWKSTVQFELKEYVLPTFEVIIEGQSQIIPSDNAIFATVTARYVYNKEVRGKAQVVMSVVKSGQEITRFAAEAKELNEQGRATFTVTPADSDGADWFAKFVGARLKIEAIVTEQATGDRENTTISAAKFVRQVYTFKRDRTISNYKKGTTFDVKIDIFHSDGTPGVNVPTLIEGLGYNPEGVATPLTGTADFELERSSNGLGQVDFRLDVNQNTERIEVTIKTLDNNYPTDANGFYTFTVYPIDSPSGAYLQIRVPAGEIQVVENYEAEVVKSGTVDVFGISYFVIVRGKIVQTYTDLNSNLGAQKTIRIGITKDMAPSARLVIFSFVGNEIVADSILLDIVDECQSQLIVRPDDATRSPGDVVQFTIIAEPQSRVGLLAVDEAVYFLKDFHRLTKKKMFQRMETLDLGCGPGGGGNSKEIFENAGLVALTSANFGKTSVRQGYGCPTESDNRRRRAVSENQKCYKEFEYDVDVCSACESGFLHIPGKTCVDRIKKFARRKNIDLPEDYGSPPDPALLGEVVAAFFFCCEQKEEERNVVAGRNTNLDIDIDEDESTVNVRSNFPETWIFEEYEIPDSRQIVIDFSVPDSITNWIVQASSVSAAMGMCVAEEKEIEVSKDVFIQLKMPYSMVRGEQTQIQATLFNYGSREVTGNMYLYGVDGVCSESLPGIKGPKHQLTVPKNDARTTYFNIIPFNVGNPQIEVKAFTTSGNDGIRKQILVVPEGVERYHSKVLLIDPTGSRASEAEEGEVQEPDQPLDNEFPFKPETFTDHENSLQRDTVDIAIVDFNAIPGTEQCFITFFGDVMTPSVSSIIEGLDPGSLLGKPMGCGEQTMMFMSANVYTMLYLDKTAQITAEVEESGFSKVDKSYQRMINYQRTDDGSFSAWGDRRPGSTWLTAYTVKAFYNVLVLGRFVDDTVLCNAFKFFETRYVDIEGVAGQGRFYEGNSVVHKDMAGGISGDMMMNAFVVTTLAKYNPGNLEQPVACNLNYADKLGKAIAYLEANFNTLETVYHRTVVAYALNVVNSIIKDEVWAKVKEDASFDIVKGLRHFTMNSKALTVEATSYALLTAVYRNEITYANGMVNWLTEHRDFKRGFSSTSDTAIAFEALATYSSETSTTSVNMRCELSSTSTNNYEEIVEITDTTATLSQRRECPTDGLLVIECSGEGVAQAEVEVIYNTPADTPGEECAFFIFAQMIELDAEAEAEKKIYRMDITVKYQLEVNGETDMAIVEVGLFTGFTPVQSTLDNLVASVEYPVERYETSDRKVTLYLETLTSELTTLPFNVEQTFQMANVQAASVTVFDYYFPEKRCTAFYNPHDDQTELRQACEGDVCVCAAGPCPICGRAGEDLKTYNELYHELACGPQSGIDYVFEAVAQAVEVSNGFITLTATVSTRMKKGRDQFEEVGDDEGSPRNFIIKSSCAGCDVFELGHKYLIMGKDGIPYKDGNFTKYKYLLDTTSYLEKWPKKADNKARAKEFNKFKNTLKNEGCAA
ncbi:complement C3-like [Antedon mediterranea]|uniref:complement C3-like n=1 Tax=Antedon mediterranea TaxID=105859 RepID=UPI003AF66880